MQSQSRAPDNTLGQHDKVYSWFPIVVGGLIGLGLGFLLELLGAAMGLSLFTTDPSGARTLVISGLIGMLVGTIVIMYVTGFTAGYLSADSVPQKNLGILYGFAAWSFSLILMVLLATAIGNHMARYMQGYTATSTVISVNDRMSPILTPESTSRERNIKTAGAASFAVFLLFFAGALSAAYGGHCGHKCWVKHK